jgi:hypothetical protein
VPDVVAARVRLGVALPSGRIAGCTDQDIHLIPIPTGPGLPSRLRAYCGMTIQPDVAEFVSVASGAPCPACLLLAPNPS